MEEEGVYLTQGAHVVLQPKKYLMAQHSPHLLVYRGGGGGQAHAMGMAARIPGATRGDQGVAQNTTPKSEQMGPAQVPSDA